MTKMIELIKENLLPQTIEDVSDIENLVIYEMVFLTYKGIRGHASRKGSIHEELTIRSLKRLTMPMHSIF